MVVEAENHQQFVFVGLGNPGKKYELTRHNMGFLVIDRFSKLHGIPLKEDKKICASMGKGMVNEQLVHLIKPLTYMNVSGQAVRRYIDYFKLTARDIVVVTDDVAIPFGELRLRAKGSAGGHNGLKSIEEHLGSNQYARLRMGIGRKLHSKEDIRDFVLDPFSRGEVENLPFVLNEGVKALELLLTQSFASVMNVVNSKVKPEEEK